MEQKIPLKANESIIFRLRSLYDAYGYSHYKMSKFEEYDLYSKNKDFLVSDGVITFTDTNGKLMALKPDVTLSIIKNTVGHRNEVEKLYYNENVYRVSKGTHSFKEIMQTGLECIGKTDRFCVYEVLCLALKSLEALSDSCVLELSHMGILWKLLDELSVGDEVRAELLKSISEKNLHTIKALCLADGVSEEKTGKLLSLIALHGSAAEVLPKARTILDGVIADEVFDDFSETVLSLPTGKCAVNVDFSLVEDADYYNGIVFKGFLQGVPSSVLSGGQYDTLMKKMHRSEGGIGFAVYLDSIEALYAETDPYDVDTVLLYEENEPLSVVEKAADLLRQNGAGVLAANKKPLNIRARKICRLFGGKVTEVEDHA